MKQFTLLLSGALVLAPLASPTRAQEITVLSSRADTVSDSDALVSVAIPSGAGAVDLNVTSGGADVTRAFTRKGDSMIGLVTGLKPGPNRLTATVRGRSRSVIVVNHGRNGPIFSGPHQKPFICETNQFKLPDGSTLGPPTDADCNASTRVMFVYRTTANSTFKPLPEGGAMPADMSTTTTLDGRRVNYIVRLETGTVNRAIYQTAMLLDPTKRETFGPTATYYGWNGKAVYVFGGGATAGYHQGAATGEVLNHEMLSRGFAVLSSSLNVMATVGSDVLSAETAAMVKERFIETYGPPKYLMGWGGSGGSMQQHLIANNYPGILDGIIPGSSFPDLYTLVPYAADCALMDRAFDGSKQSWTVEQKRAASGLNTWTTCVGWARIFTPQWMQTKQAEPPRLGLPASSCHPVVPRAATYDPVTNPGGARCDIYSAARNSLGFNPKTGATWRAYDNVGVQYGLNAYKAGAISADQFVELNETMGGYDRNGNFQQGRTVADPIALRRMFEFGRVNQGQNLDDLPMIDIRANPGLGGDVHDAIKSENMRARLIRSNGGASGQVIVRGEAWPTTAGSGEASRSTQMNVFVLLKMDEWLDNIAKDAGAYSSRASKVVANKPADLTTDVCFMTDGTRIDEASSLANEGPCGSKLPYFDDPRMAAGAPLTNDVLKCQLRPVDPREYQGMTTELLKRLRAVFPNGVCDYGKRSVGFRRLKGTWLSYSTPGIAKRMH